ncbi:hypothetical protein LUZ63_020357 [Rhynchospora breviuscula]|uniref:Alanine racemase N-terminal domain-containing protein n=1 Tax=Rhynchospora breviuscula TaxID=2022672 RepID=A0A9Q0C113_9POAL|nr:hypothetical protein LUZ63_020357 [Rhynchospora breviuscula]
MSETHLRVRTISVEEHRAHLEQVVAAGGSASFLQTPAWARVKPEWRPESIGWEDAGGRLVGVALVLYRQLPRVKRYLAYLPEGPVIDWSAPDLSAWLDPMTAHLRERGAFGVRIGPPVVTRRWSAQQVKDGIADDATTSLTSLPPTERGVEGARVLSALREHGWRHQGAEGGFAAGQPQYNFVVPLRLPDGTPRTEAEVLAGMNQLWRRNIKKADKAGVEVTTDGPGRLGRPENTVEAFHELYVETAARDHFTPRPLGYFRTMVEALSAEDPDRIRLWFARHEGDLVAATIAIRVGSHAWYSYGASSTRKREVRGSNATQWAMIRDAIAAKADVYDLRGITDTLDAADSHVGLIQFKVGTGGEAVEHVGEWDLPLRRATYAAFALYMSRSTVPVVKGNGYGFGRGRLARRAEWLGVDTVAVGQYDELGDVAPRFGGSLLVLTPWRPFHAHAAPLSGPDGRRVVHTVGRIEDLRDLVRRCDLPGSGPRVVLELLTSMRRHGLTAAGLREIADSSVGNLTVEGVALHLPLADSGGPGHVPEVDRLLDDVVAADLETRTIWVSHLSAAELATLRGRWPELTFRPRSGTGLWLGDRGALEVRATVLDVHPVERGTVYGYRGRSAPRKGHLVVVAGGTAHGIGLEAPLGDQSLRSRAASVARGGLDAAGFVRSPFSIAGKPRLFAEPPHMQASMLFLPAGVAPPAVGDEVPVRVRYTTTDVDEVSLG